MNKNYL
ncbi:Putative uncharacterized protein [Lactococcus lactis subsp. lactis A12]|nr:Putative uncharacterized protein [Lactococcus lactis subsp. lactis A12]SBW29239.1 Hypothetical protein LLA12_00057 [Lactococcus lactis subsp. lactis]